MLPRSRRKFLRAYKLAINASVLARGERRPVVSVENLSASGALLRGDLALALGEGLQVVLDVGEVPLLVSAVVVRIHPRAELYTTIAVAFLDVPPATQDDIQNLVLNALEDERAGSLPTVITVGFEPELCATLESELGPLGRAVISASTTLEAIWHLEDRDRSYDAAIIDLDRAPADLDILRHLADAHPHVMRIAISARSENWCRDLQSLDVCLPKPWDAGEIATLLRPPLRSRGNHDDDR